VIELEAAVSWNWPRLLLYVAGDLGRYERGEISSPITCVESPIDEFPVGEARFGIAGEEG
jgi:hypothetical protein